MTPSQSWDPERYARHARFVSEFGLPLLEVLRPKAGERILDLGCGDGALTERLAAFGCEVVGVDSSPDQVAAARARGLDARLADGQTLAFEGEFDAVFSNAALHWMPRADAVIAGVWRALKRGGRFVAECGGAGNIAHVEAALCEALERRRVDGRALNPWYFPVPAEYRARFEAQGFSVDHVELFPRPTPLPGDIADWLVTFAEPFLHAVPAQDQPRLVEEVRAALRPRLCDAKGTWVVDYVRLRVSARRPAG